MFIAATISERSIHQKFNTQAKHEADKESSGEEGTDDVISSRSRSEDNSEHDQNKKADKTGWSDSLSLFGKDDVIRSGVLGREIVNISKIFLNPDFRIERSIDRESTALSLHASETVTKKPRTLFTNTRHNFFNSEDKFIIPKFEICRNVTLKPHQKLVLLLIPSEPKNSLRRQVIRTTWLNITRSLTDDYVLLHLFVLGKNSEVKTNPRNWELSLELLKLENTIHKDLLIGDFIEDYWNLTYKTIFGVTFANFYCQNANYIFKIDDDVFVRPEKLIPLMDGLPSSNFFGGNCIKKGKPHRTKKSKWYISKAEYPRIRYPPFCFGPAYFFSGDITSHLFNATLELQYFKLEDVYMGLCIEKAGKTVQSVAGVSNTSPKYTYCVYKDLALAHGIEPTKWSMYYRDLVKREPQKIVCPKKTVRKSSRQL